MDSDLHDKLRTYVTDLFAREDEALRSIRADAEKQNLPAVSIKPDEGRLLQFLMRAVDARRVIEIGTLAGYSGVWIARALPPEGKLITLEVEPRHAQIARRNFERAGVAGRVEIRLGQALESLRALGEQAPFDAVFIDADKPRYPAYLEWALDHVRPGGLIAAHNALRRGEVVDPAIQSPEIQAIRQVNDTLAHSERVLSDLIQVGDGLVAAIVLDGAR